MSFVLDIPGEGGDEILFWIFWVRWRKIDGNIRLIVPVFALGSKLLNSQKFYQTHTSISHLAASNPAIHQILYNLSRTLALIRSLGDTPTLTGKRSILIK